MKTLSHFQINSDLRFDSHDLRAANPLSPRQHPNVLFIFISAVKTNTITDTDPWFLLSLRLTNVSLIQSNHRGRRVSGLQTLSDNRAPKQTAHQCSRARGLREPASMLTFSSLQVQGVTCLSLTGYRGRLRVRACTSVFVSGEQVMKTKQTVPPRRDCLLIGIIMD